MKYCVIPLTHGANRRDSSPQGEHEALPRQRGILSRTKVEIPTLPRQCGIQDDESKVIMDNKAFLLKRARELRKNMTPQEHLLWYRFLRGYPLKIYKQRIFEGYIVDFYCDKAKLVIEVDGSQHYEPEDAEYDRKRTKALNQIGLTVLRVSNREVNLQFDEVCEYIHNTIVTKIGYDPYQDTK